MIALNTKNMFKFSSYVFRVPMNWLHLYQQQKTKQKNLLGQINSMHATIRSYGPE